MARPNRKMSLSARLAWLVFAVVATLLAAFSASAYWGFRQALRTSFDLGLKLNAEALATLTEEDNDEKHGVELDFADEHMRRFSQPDRPDIFAVMLEDGSVLGKSRALEDVPEFAFEPEQEAAYRDLTFHDQPYRGIVLRTFPKSEPDDQDEDEDEDEGRDEEGNERGAIGIQVFFATSAEPLQRQLNAIGGTLAGLSLIGLLLSGLLAWLVARYGLKPVRQLAGETAAIDAEALNHRLAANALPSDLAPMALAVNEMLARLESAFQRERQFSADAAHELRTPVATLKSGVQAALLKHPDPQEYPLVLQDLLADVERLEGLCDSLLLVCTQPGAANQKQLSGAEWLAEIAGVVESLQPLAEDHCAALSFAKPDDLPAGARIRCDAAAAQRIATNLIGNAIHHGGAGVRVVATAAFENGTAVFSVLDDGPGVPPEDAAQLFDRFYRVDKARSREDGGAGLGLAICRALAHAFGGQIVYEPNQPQGCRFHWTAPVERQ